MNADPDPIPLAFAGRHDELDALAAITVGAAEGLDRVACAPNVKYLVEVAVGEAMRGGSRADWHAMVLNCLGQPVLPVLDEAEACMRSAGLWPWN